MSETMPAFPWRSLPRGNVRRLLAGAAVASGSLYMYSRLLPLSVSEEQRRHANVPVYAWGNNANRLAAPNAAQHTIKQPQVISFQGKRLVSVAASERHAAAVDVDGNLFQWGVGLVDGAHEPICTQRGLHLSQVVCTPQATVALSEETGKLYIFPLGTHGDLIDVSPTEFEGGERAVKVVAGRDHLAVLSSKGRLFTAELNDAGNHWGQLGCGPTTLTRRPRPAKSEEASSASFQERLDAAVSGVSPRPLAQTVANEPPTVAPLHPKLHFHPVQVPVASGAIVDVVSGNYHTLFRTDDGRVFGFGSNEKLQLGLGPYDPERILIAEPLEITTLWGPTRRKPRHSRVTHMAAGAETSYFVVEDGDKDKVHLLACGLGISGQLGCGAWSHVVGHPIPIKNLSGISFYDETTKQMRPIRVKYLSAGHDHAAVVVDAGNLVEPFGDDVFVWGGNRHSQLGISGCTKNFSTPTSPLPFVTHPLQASEGEGSSTGPATSSWINESQTVAIAAGGQFKLVSGDPDTSAEPLAKIFCGPEITIIY